MQKKQTASLHFYLDRRQVIVKEHSGQIVLHRNVALLEMLSHGILIGGYGIIPQI